MIDCKVGAAAAGGRWRGALSALLVAAMGLLTPVRAQADADGTAAAQAAASALSSMPIQDQHLYTQTTTAGAGPSTGAVSGGASVTGSVTASCKAPLGSGAPYTTLDLSIWCAPNASSGAIDVQVCSDGNCVSTTSTPGGGGVAQTLNAVPINIVITQCTGNACTISVTESGNYNGSASGISNAGANGYAAATAASGSPVATVMSNGVYDANGNAIVAGSTPNATAYSGYLSSDASSTANCAQTQYGEVNALGGSVTSCDGSKAVTVPAPNMGGYDQQPGEASNNAYPQAAQYMAMLDALKKQINGATNPPTLFTGTAEICKQQEFCQLGSCCCDPNVTEGGTLVWSCDHEAADLAGHRRQGLSYEVASGCAGGIPNPFGSGCLTCTETEEWYCSFDSKLALEIQVQGRQQLAAMATQGQGHYSTLSYQFTFYGAGSGGGSASPPTVTLALSSSSIVSGSASTLSWTSSNSSSCAASDGWSGSKAVSGQQSMSPSASTTYTLTCTGAGGSVSQSVTLTVTGGNSGTPSIAFNGKPLQINIGLSAVLTWSVSNASHCSASGGWTGDSIALSGTATVTPSYTTTYGLDCVGSSGATVSASVTITVNTTPAQPPTVNFSAAPLTLMKGQSTTLTWTSTGATSCQASGGWSGAESVNGSVTLAPTVTTSYTLTCSGSGGSTPATVTVTVNPPPIIAFTASPTAVAIGGSTTLGWNVTGASSCIASGGWAGSVPISGSQAEVIEATTTYTLTCNGAGGSTAASVIVSAYPPPTLTLSAAPSAISAGASATLSWSSTNATSCTATGGWSGTKAVSGSLAVTPTATTSYSLSCTGTGGSVSQTVTVTVDPLPVIDFYATLTTVSVGQSTQLNWSAANATACTASGAWSGAVAATGTRTVTMTSAGTRVYSLTCSNITGGSASASVTIMVVDLPTVSVVVSPTAITQGQGASLSWTTTNASACTASGSWSGSKATSGTLSLTPAAVGTFTYTLQCTNAAGAAGSSSSLLTVSPKPTVKLTVSPATIILGGPATLTWSSSNATSCTATGAWSGSQTTSGSLGVSPATTGSFAYTLTCYNAANGLASATATLQVNPPPIALNLTDSYATIPVGGSSLLSWTSSNASSCTASGGWSGGKPVNGSQSVSPTATTTYTLSCSGAGGTLTRSVTIKVQPPASLTLTVSPTTLNPGGSAVLSWSSANAGTCTASGGWSGAQALSGSKSVAPATTTTYSLTCAYSGYPGDTVTKSVTVTVAAKPTVSLSLTPALLAPGKSYTLSWSSTNANSCTASGAWSGAKATSGTQSLSQATVGTWTYTLTCTGAGGTATQSVTVTVASPPTVTLTAAPTSVAPGQSFNLTWSSSNATSCAASNAWSGTEPTSGTATRSEVNAGTYSFVLTCTGAGGSASATATVKVAPPPPTVSLSASPTVVEPGQSFTLIWSSTNATSCTASGNWSGTQALNGSRALQESSIGSYTFKLSCSGSGGSASQSVTVTVRAPPPPPSLTITATPPALFMFDGPGQERSSTLNWSTTNATSCTASGTWTGSMPTSGSQQETFGWGDDGTYTYSLMCTGPGGSVSRSATITVNTGDPCPKC